MDWLERLCLLLGVWVLYHLSFWIYNIFFHPLRRYPGPWLEAATKLPYVYFFVRGIYCKRVCDLHQRYGNVVRIAPNQLSFLTTSAAKSIYGGKSQAEFDKAFVSSPKPEEIHDLFFAQGNEHARYRKLMSPAFSDATLRAQESMIQDYCDHMVQGLRNRSGIGHYPNQDGVVDMAFWTKFAVSDILSHILFGSGLDCLKKGEYHPWLDAGHSALVMATFQEVLHRLWPFHRICEYFTTPTHARGCRQTHLATNRQKLEERAKLDKPYKFDFPTFVAKSMTEQECSENIQFIGQAGGHTTSSTLSNILYYLTHNPDAYKKVVAEVRGAFEKEEDIDAVTSGSLRYLRATIRETFRIHPSVPDALLRITPKEGKFIDGNWVPGGTWVGAPNLAACRTPSHWKDPERFVPERWLGAPEYESDNREASRPYSLGLKSCLGKSRANTMMRIILCRLLWNFDLQAQPGNTDPHYFVEYETWQVEPLMIRLTAVRQQ